jgi:hypothetical protein
MSSRSANPQTVSPPPEVRILTPTPSVVHAPREPAVRTLHRGERLLREQRDHILSA